MIPLALTRNDVADYVDALFLVFVILILLNVLLSFIPRIPFYSPWLRAVLDFITETTNPYLNLFRRVLPQMRAGGGLALDFSPILAIILLVILQAVVVGLIRG